MTEQLSEKLPETKTELRNLKLAVQKDGDWDLADIIGVAAGMQLDADQLLYGKALVLIQQKNEQIADQQKRIAELTEENRPARKMFLAQRFVQDLLRETRKAQEHAEKAEAKAKELERYDIRQYIPDGVNCGQCDFSDYSYHDQGAWHPFATCALPDCPLWDIEHIDIRPKHPNCPKPAVQPEGERQ